MDHSVRRYVGCQEGPSFSPFGSDVLFVPKPNVKFGLCVDYHGLNAITVADCYTLPRINYMIDKAVGSRWFSKMDPKGDGSTTWVNNSGQLTHKSPAAR